jgi:hypothetical protein
LAKRADMDRNRSGALGAKRFRMARHARPKVLRPREIGRSKPAARAIAGSAWIGM